MTNILTIKEGKKTITLISDAGKKLDERIHLVAVSGIAHCLQHKDTTLISELVHAMPKSARGNALKFFLTKYLPIKWDSKAHGGKGGYKLNKDHGIDSMHWAQKAATVLAADASPFYMKEDKEASVFNPNNSVVALVNKMKKEHTAFNAEGVAALESLLAIAKSEAQRAA